MAVARWVVALAVFTHLFVGCSFAAEAPSRQSLDNDAKVLLGRLPILFERNLGQTKAEYKYLTHEEGMGVALSRDRVSFFFPAATGEAQQFLSMEFVGRSRKSRLYPLEQRRGHINYLVGRDAARWKTQIPTFSKIRYNALYPGVDLVFYGNGRELEHDFALAPGVDPRSIVLQVDGARNLSINASGDLLAQVGKSELRVRKPVAYQVTPAGKRSVETKYSLRGSRVSFLTNSYDHRLPLIIDPAVTYSTWLAGSNRDTVAGVAVDSAGYLYVTGTTGSTDFPTKGGYVCTTCTHKGNLFITKLDPTGSTLVYSTYMGGSGGDQSYGIGIDSNGNALVGGTTGSSDFPLVNSYTTFSGFTTTYAFVLSLSADGTQLNYSSLLGQTGLFGTYPTSPMAFTVDSAGDAFLTGQTYDAAFPITPGTIGTSIVSYPFTNLFVTKLDPTGNLSYSTIIPGTLPYTNYAFDKNDFPPYAVGIDSSGAAYIGGKAGPGLPTTAGTISPAFAGDLNNPSSYVGFLLKINATASSIVFGTYIPNTDFVRTLAPHTSGTYIAGSTSSTSFAVTPGAFQTTIPPGQFCTCNAGYVADVNSAASAYTNATFLAGTPATSNFGTNIMAIAVDDSESPWVSGVTGSSDFPLKVPAMALFPEAQGGGFVTQLKADLSSLLFSTFLTGTSGIYHTYQLFLWPGANGTAFAAGSTDDADFPTTAGSFEPALPAGTSLNNTHTTVARIDTNIPAPAASYSPVLVNFGNQAFGVSSLPETVTVSDLGNANLQVGKISLAGTDFSQTNTCTAPVPPGNSCQINVVFTPSTVVQQVQQMTVATNSFGPSQVIVLQGAGNPGFALTSPGNVPPSQTVSAGQSAIYNLNLISGGYFGNVALSCSGAPQYATCTVNPSSIALANNQQAALTVSISTSQLALAAAKGNWDVLAGGFLLAVAFAPLGFRKETLQRKLRAICPVARIVPLIFLAGIAVSCGGSSGGAPGPSSHTVSTGTYTLQLAATSGGMAQNINLTLKVQ
ncbi:MAG: repeat containing protein [Candidatus Sulfotelmatobacter sp.]|nr:repeat containing protein [Candidatus Sulfotelmatobacter sp.]